MLVFLASFYGLLVLVQGRLSIPPPQAPFVTMISLASALYVAALFGLLLYVSWMVFIAGLVSSAMFLHRQARYFSPASVIRNRSWYPPAAFGVMFLAGRVVSDGAYLTSWDEFSFWGIFPKILASTDEVVAGFNSINKADYPRGTAILQYYFILFLNDGAFRDDLAILAQISLFSSAVPAFLFSRDRRFLPHFLFYALTVLVYYAIFWLFVAPVYSLYADSAIALCWAMSIILYMTNRDARNPMLATGIALFFMTQLKEIALFFALTAIFVIAVEYALNSGRSLSRKARNIGFLIAVVTASSISWSIFLHHNGVTHSSFSVDTGALAAGLEDYQLATIENYLKFLYRIGDLSQVLLDGEGKVLERVSLQGFVRPHFGVSLSPLYWFIVFIAGMIVVSLRKEPTTVLFGRTSSFYRFLFCLVLVTFGYVCLILFLYLTAFHPYEAIRLASFGRYLGTQYLGLFLILIFLLSMTKNKASMMKNKALRVFPCLLALSLLALSLLIISPYPKGLFKDLGLTMKNNNDTYTQLDDFYGVVDPVIEEIKKESNSARILFINQGGWGSFLVKLRYRAFPLMFPHGMFSILPERKEGWSPLTQVVSPDDFGATLRDVDYLIVWNDKYFWESYDDVVRRAELKGIWDLQDGVLVPVN